jgi:hypothetical protein
MHINRFVNDDAWMAQSVYLKQVRSLAKILFRKNFGPPTRLDCYAGTKGRVDTVNGASRNSHFLLYLVRLKQTTPLDWLVRVTYHVEVSSSVIREFLPIWSLQFCPRRVRDARHRR